MGPVGRSEAFRKSRPRPEIGRFKLGPTEQAQGRIALGPLPDAGGIAAPVFNRDGTVDAALLVGAPIARFRRELAGLKRIVAEVAARASAALGYAAEAGPSPQPSPRARGEGGTSAEGVGG
jgi:hypothetical protein